METELVNHGDVFSSSPGRAQEHEQYKRTKSDNANSSVETRFIFGGDKGQVSIGSMFIPKKKPLGMTRRQVVPTGSLSSVGYQGAAETSATDLRRQRQMGMDKGENELRALGLTSRAEFENGKEERKAGKTRERDQDKRRFQKGALHTSRVSRSCSAAHDFSDESDTKSPESFKKRSLLSSNREADRVFEQLLATEQNLEKLYNQTTSGARSGVTSRKAVDATRKKGKGRESEPVDLRSPTKPTSAFKSSNRGTTSSNRAESNARRSNALRPTSSSRSRSPRKTKETSKTKGRSTLDGVPRNRLVSVTKSEINDRLSSTVVEVSDTENDEDDELALGSTPPKHQSEGYRDKASAASSSSLSNGKANDVDAFSLMYGSQAPTKPIRNGRRLGRRDSDVLVSPSDESMVFTPKPSRSLAASKRADRTINTTKNKATKRRSSNSSDNDETVVRVGKGKGRPLSVEDSTPKSRNMKYTREGASKADVKAQHEDSDDDYVIHTKKSPVKRRKTTVSQRYGKKTINSDDEDTTPAPFVPEKLTPETQKEREDTTRQPSVRNNDKGFYFFETLSSNMDSSDYDEFDDEFLDGPSILVNADDELDAEKMALLGEDEFTKKEREYLLSHMDWTNLCPYCNLPLPNKPSKHHEYLKAKLHKLSTPAPTDENPNARALSWQKAIEFCSLHHAETTIIPLGIRAGFPVDIDFGNLDRRLETGWIRNELDKIVRQPEESAVFREVKKEVEEVGRMKWSSLAHQSKEERLAAVKPGYYGELGRIIITDHFQLLRRLNYMMPNIPPAKSASELTQDVVTAIDPLSPSDFIANVLVPEAANFLIMQDRGREGFDQAAYEAASKTRTESSKYGEWKFPEASKSSKRVLEDLRSGIDDKRRRLAKIRGKKKMKSEKENLESAGESGDRQEDSIVVEESSKEVHRSSSLYDKGWEEDHWKSAAKLVD